MEISFKIYDSTATLPENWDDLAVNNIFLSKKYLCVLDKSAPANMSCLYIGFYQNNQLLGICLSQFINANQLNSFGDRDKCIKTAVRNFAFKNFCSHVLFIGNNMLTGQNAFYFSDKLDLNEIAKSMASAIDALKVIYKNSGKKVHITSIKDFSETEIKTFQNNYFNDYFQFSIQPNMVFKIPINWTDEKDYIAALSKKYRDQHKRARKKMVDISRCKMNLQDILNNEKAIYELYFHVAKNAPFNTFFLAENHFSVFKEYLKDDFLFYGYFIDDKLIGFNTLIKNNGNLDTYFLGYDNAIQKDKMLYLNMLYDMTAFAINQNYKQVIFARTALEIKSSVGAKPTKMFGLIKHSNRFINKYMYKIFPYLEPDLVWHERNPFK